MNGTLLIKDAPGLRTLLRLVLRTQSRSCRTRGGPRLWAKPQPQQCESAERVEMQRAAVQAYS